MENLSPFWLLIISASMAALPFFVLLGTSFLKVSVVFGMLKSGLGTQTTPGPMTISAIALSVSAFVMAPTIEASFAKLSALDFAQIQKLKPIEAVTTLAGAAEPFKLFLQANIGERELSELTELSRSRSSSLTPAKPEVASSGPKTAVTPQDTSPTAIAEPTQSAERSLLQVLLPGFVLTELKEAFSMAFVLLLPFLVIDLIVSNVLVGLGMTMVSPVTVSLPIKLIVFVFADGWLLLTKGLILSYGIGG